MNGNIIVVGKNSYIGGYFGQRAMASNANITSLSSQDCNFLDEDDVSDFFGSLPNEVYSVIFAAVVNKHVANSFQSFNDNLRIVRNLIIGQKMASIESIIYLSSVDVYGSKPALPITEQSQVNPDTWYGLAKYNCEWMLTSAEEVQCPVTVLRIPGVYGRSKNDRSVIGKIVSSMRKDNCFIINGSGKTLRDYVYIEDIYSLLTLLVPLRYQGVLNVVSGEKRSILEITKLVGDVLELEADIVHEAADEERDFDLVFDNRGLTSVLTDFRFSDMAVGIRSYL